LIHFDEVQVQLAQHHVLDHDLERNDCLHLL